MFSQASVILSTIGLKATRSMVILVTVGSVRIFYRPQQSWGKVIFSQASVILFTGGVCLSACWDTPLGPGRHPPPRPGRHPPGPEQAPPRTRQAPPDQAAPPPGPDRQPPRTRQAPPPPKSRAYFEIWSTSGWYASYWNAILHWNAFLY